MDERLQAVFRQVFDDDTIVLMPTMTAQDIPDWDSLNHISLLVAVESEFGIKFTTNEIASLKQVGDLQNLVTAKLQAKG